MASELVLGIDLGTTNSCVAVVENDKPIVIPDRAGRKTQPSIVSFFPNHRRVVGHEAKEQLIYNPRFTVYSAKRLLGRAYSSEEVERFIGSCPYEIVEGVNQSVLVRIFEELYTLPQISGFVLAHMKKVAEEYLGETVDKAVITVPANFNDLQRNATKQAGEFAGLQVLRILNEPTAAALAYGFGNTYDQKVIIYDFGGGTFDATLLAIQDDVFQVIGTAGDTFLGGDDLDNRIVDLVVDNYQRAYKIDVSEDLVAMLRVRYEAERAKKLLSSETAVQIQIPALMYTDTGAVDLNVTLTRETFNKIAEEFVNRSLDVCQKLLAGCRMSPADIENVVLVGGSTNIPLVREGVQRFFGRTPFWGMNPDEVVAVGAAIQGSVLAGRQQRSFGTGGAQPMGTGRALLLDVTPHTLGVATVGGRVEPIIAKNTPIPVEQARIFTTSRDDQTTVRLRVYQGEETVETKENLLGLVVLEDLRPGPRGAVQVEVLFEIDTNGILNVSATELATGRKAQASLSLVGKADERGDVASMMRQDDLPKAVR